MNRALICRSLVHSWVHSCQSSLYSTPNQYFCSDQFSNPITHWYLSEISWQSLGLTPDSSYCEGISLMSGRRGGSPRLNRQLYTQLISGNSNPPPRNTTHSITGGLHSQPTLNYPHVGYHVIHSPLSTITKWVNPHNISHRVTPHTQQSLDFIRNMFNTQSGTFLLSWVLSTHHFLYPLSPSE